MLVVSLYRVFLSLNTTLFPEKSWEPWKCGCGKKTLATFRLPIKQIIPLFPTPKKINTLYNVLLISSGN